MPESTLARCLELCQTAKNLHGSEQRLALDELASQLASMGPKLGARSRSASALNVQRVIEQLHEPIISMDLTGYLTGWNMGAQILFGYTQQEALGRHFLFLYADDGDPSDNPMPESFLEQGDSYVEVRRRKKSGEVFNAGLSLSVLRDDDDEAIGIIAHLSEITDRIASQEKLRLHGDIVQNSDQGILITDPVGTIVSVNAAFSRITGYPPEEAIGQTVDLLRSGTHDASFRAQVHSAMAGAGPWQGEITGRRKNGELFPQSVSIYTVRDDKGVVAHAFSIFSDISMLRASEERMWRLANYDSVTGLPNRSLFMQLVEAALNTAHRNNRFCVFLTINLHRFASINDTLGHAVGDEVLRQLSLRFRQALRDEDLLARVDGNEFVAALLSIGLREHGGYVAQKLLSALDAPFIVASKALYVRARIGISVFPEDGVDAVSLLRFADVAAQRVLTEEHLGYLFYRPEMDQRAKDKLQLESELREALDTNQLRLHYQPKVSFRSGRIVGAEALIRWPHAQRGMVSPSLFIPVAEETGLILEIGSWVLDEACSQIRRWMDASVEMPPIAVNLSARQFDRLLPRRLQDTLDRHRVPARLLKLEITESLLVRGSEAVIPIMNELVALGFELAIDDFGTGYSSLSYLKKFPITTLKIDRSFLTGLPHDANDRAIALAIITMGQQLRLEIVAEGVETMEQMAFLRDLQCDQLQGFLFSPGVPSEEFERMVRADHRLKFV